MAKKKQSNEDPAATTRKRSSAAKTRKAPAKSDKAAKPQAHGTPLVDTQFAAEAAARALAARAKLQAALGQQPQVQEQPQKESGNFKQLKESLNKPAHLSGGSTLGNAFGPGKVNLPAVGRKESFHSQTTGGVSRINVPRRTNG